jgi:putative membrane protein
MKKIAVTALGLCCLTGAAFAQDTGDRTTTTTSGQTATTDRTTTRTADASSMQHSKLSSAEFVKKAAADGLAEVEAGKLGAEKATNPQVKAYAQRIVADHTKANKELMAAAKAKGLEVPTEPGLMQKGMKEKFEHQKADADFDHDFMEHMVTDHKKAVELFTTASTDPGVDTELRAWAKKTLPTLSAHLKEAQTLEAKLDQKE